MINLEIERKSMKCVKTLESNAQLISPRCQSKFGSAFENIIYVISQHQVCQFSSSVNKSQQLLLLLTIIDTRLP